MKCEDADVADARKDAHGTKVPKGRTQATWLISWIKRAKIARYTRQETVLHRRTNETTTVRAINVHRRDPSSSSNGYDEEHRTVRTPNVRRGTPQRERLHVISRGAAETSRTDIVTPAESRRSPPLGRPRLTRTFRQRRRECGNIANVAEISRRHRVLRLQRRTGDIAAPEDKIGVSGETSRP